MISVFPAIPVLLWCAHYTLFPAGKRRMCAAASVHAITLRSHEAGLALGTPGYHLRWRNIVLCLPEMALSIKDPATERCVRELAALTGESVAIAVRRAAEERLQRVRRSRESCPLAAEILEIGKRCAALPDLDRRTADEILGYDEHGLPR
jgi:antitoxin VapB